MLKKIKWFLFYRKIIHQNEKLLYQNHDLKIDWVNRLYKTYNLNNNDIDEIKSYGNKYINTLLEKDKSKIETTLLDLKIHQFVGLMEIEQLNERQIGIAFRYKYFDTAKLLNKIIWSSLIIVSMLLSYLISPNIISPIIGLLIIFGIYLLTRLFIINRLTN